MSTELTNWLYTNAPAAWLSATVALCTLCWLLYSRKKPKRLVMTETANISLLDIRAKIRKRMGITFDGEEINALRQLEFEVYNEGMEVIVKPCITVTLSPEAMVLDCFVSINGDQPPYEISENKIAITLPFVNSIQDHSEIITIAILADDIYGSAKVSGGGEGWSVRQNELLTPSEHLIATLKFAGLSTIFFLTSILYILIVKKYVPLQSADTGWQGFFYALPVLITITTSLVFLLKFMYLSGVTIFRNKFKRTSLKPQN